MKRRHQLLGLIIPAGMLLVLCCGIVRAHIRDPLRRIPFVVASKSETLPGLIVRKNTDGRSPVILFFHQSQGSYLKDGKDVCRLASLGFAVVDCNYDGKADIFDDQLQAVLGYVRKQQWAETNSIVWLDCRFPLVARYWQAHVEDNPKLLITLVQGQPLDKTPDDTLASPEPSSVLLVVTHKGDAQMLNSIASQFQRRRVTVGAWTVPDGAEDDDANHSVLLSAIGDYCKTRFRPDLSDPQHGTTARWLAGAGSTLACLFFIGICGTRRAPLHFRHLFSTANQASPGVAGTRLLLARVVAGILCVCVLPVVLVHLLVPRLPVNHYTLEIAEHFLAQPTECRDIESLAQLPIWSGHRVGSLLGQVQMARYTVNQLIDWRFSYPIYLNFVLSPIVAGEAREMDWRRDLWLNFYQPTRHAHTAAAAASAVGSVLRQSVTIAPGRPAQNGVQSMWKSRIVNLPDYEILYVAALRSVGVPSRLNSRHRAECWTGTDWFELPLPLTVVVSNPAKSQKT